MLAAANTSATPRPADVTAAASERPASVRPAATNTIPAAIAIAATDRRRPLHVPPREADASVLRYRRSNEAPLSRTGPRSEVLDVDDRGGISYNSGPSRRSMP
jgi:hypothetical protein